MSTKHNVAKTGSNSNYKERLKARGLNKAPMMPFFRADRGKVTQHATPWFIHGKKG